MKRTDSELLTAAQAGEATALEEILERHEKQVFRFGLRMCGSEDDAREVLQDTLLAAFRGLHDFRGDSTLSTWLYQIARSFCLKRRRRSAGEPDSLQSIDDPEATAVATEAEPADERAHAREIGELLQAAILALPEAQREVIVLRDVEGLPAEEAAHVLGIEVGALKSRLHRARFELRGRLSGLLGELDDSAHTPCPELAHELSGYLSADIDQATCMHLEQHLVKCERCAAACESLKRSISLCSRLPGGEVPAPIRTAVRRALRAALAG